MWYSAPVQAAARKGISPQGYRIFLVMPAVKYRTLVRVPTSGVRSTAAEALVEIAVEECDRFYPAFQFVLWGGKTPADALEAAMVDAAGEA